MPTLIPEKQLQKYLQMRGLYHGNIDGIVGILTVKAARELVVASRQEDTSQRPWIAARVLIAAVQVLLQELDLLPQGDRDCDGLLGPRTRRAVSAYNEMMGLATPPPVPASIGVSGMFKGRAEPISDLDFALLARDAGLGEDELHAVVDVETPGDGFDSQGRPRMLFEPHVFYRNLHGTQRDRAVAQGVAYPSFHNHPPYPRDSYPRLMTASSINHHAALLSASWAIGQLMGFNYKLADYESVEAMVEAFMDSEKAQLEGMIAFIKNAGLDDALRRHDWDGFARGYNGAAYKANHHAEKLAKRYAWWRTMPDTKIPDNLRIW